jgi:peptide/nickel transport system substrate-binding protein
VSPNALLKPNRYYTLGEVEAEMEERSFWTTLNRRRLNRRSLLAAGMVTGVGVAGTALLGCSGQSKTGQTSSQATTASGSGGTPKPGGTLIVYLATSYPLDPQKVSASAQAVPGPAMSRVFKFKTSTDPATIADHVYEPDLGLSAESPDAITWTVKLRNDAKFANIAPVNGHAVEAEDIKATFTRALDPATSSPNRGQLNMIDASQITTPDKQTVVFKLNYQYAPFRSLLASPAYSWIFPREVLSGGYDPSKVVIGSGPFVFDSIQPDVAYTYKRNPDWHLKPMPYVDSLKIAIVPDNSQQIGQFTAGNLDEYTVSNPFDLPTVKQQNPKATIVKVPVGGPPSHFYFQLGEPTSPFQDIRVRRAFSMAFDRTAVAKVVFNGEGVPTVFVPLYMGKWALPVDKLDSATQQYYKYDPAQVKQLLAAAGQSNIQVRVVNPFASTNNVTMAKTVEVMNQSYNSVGIKSQIVNGDFNKDFIDAGKGWRQGYFDKDMVMFAGQAAYTEADDWLFSYFHSKSTSNQEHISDPKLDAMIDKERTLVNDDERLKAVQDIQTYLAQQMYVAANTDPYAYVALQPRVQNYCYSGTLGTGTETYAKVWLNA